MAETKKDALAAFDVFVETWGVKYDKAVDVSPRIAMRYWPSRVPGRALETPANDTSSKTRSPPCVTAPCARRDVFEEDCARDIFKLAKSAEKLASPRWSRSVAEVTSA